MDSALLGGVAALERAVAYTLGSLALVTPPLLPRPTPCDRWALRDLLEHLDDSMAALHEAAETGRVDLAPARSSDALVPRLRDRAVRLLGAWTNARDGGGVRVDDAALTAPLVAGAGAIEVTVHGWDVAQACGSSRPIPPDLADELLDLAVLMVRPGDRPGRFAPPLTAAGDAAAADRLLAFLGRRTPSDGA